MPDFFALTSNQIRKWFECEMLNAHIRTLKKEGWEYTPPFEVHTWGNLEGENRQHTDLFAGLKPLRGSPILLEPAGDFRDYHRIRDAEIEHKMKILMRDIWSHQEARYWRLRRQLKETSK